MFKEMTMVKHPMIGIVMGSDSDWPVMRPCAEMLKRFAIPYEAIVLSAHRTPDAALDYAACAQERGIKVLIGAAGGAAHLAGVLAAKSELPVLAVPMPSKHLQGLDSLLAMVQMPGALVAAGLTGTKMLLQVHDELVFEVPTDELAAATPVIRTVMANAHRPLVDLSVPLGVEIGSGPSWGDAH